MNARLEELFLAHQKELKRFLNAKVRCADTADDLIQETFLRVAQIPSSVTIENARSYLYRTASNLAIDHFRTERRRQTHPTETESLWNIPDTTAPVEHSIEGRKKLAVLKEALDELPLLTQKIFHLHRMEGRTYADVARLLKVSESTVQKHLAKALYHAMQALKSL
ncbi:RNA polymerase sigma factor [Nitrospina watsonii]|nr:RNA polymerase sigma factor [Nitrospina watsonii]